MSAQKKLRSADAASRSSKTAGSKKLQDIFIKEFFEQVPPADLEGWKKGDLAAIGKCLYTIAQEHKKGTHKVRVFTPQKTRDGWQATHTIIHIVNDDMPFLVDSVAAELGSQNLTIDALFHPVLGLTRDAKGKLKAVEGRTGGQHAESFMHIQLEQVLSADLCKKLEQSLNKVLDDVRLATTDWKDMLSRLHEVVDVSSKLGKAVDDEELDEGVAFLKYLGENNFTFLGYRRYDFTDYKGKMQSKSVAKSGFGLLRSNDDTLFGAGVGSPELRMLERAKDFVVVGKLIDKYATVHRRVPLDVIGVKCFDKDGHLSGMHVFIGLFTSSTYSCRTAEVPLVRRKVKKVLENAHFKTGSHDRKALEHILEKFPRDELFQISREDLQKVALGILRLQERQKIALFTRLDPLRQFVSCLVYVPRDRYNTKFRMQVEKILEERIGGESRSWFTTLDDSPLARVRFTIRIKTGTKPAYNHTGVEQEIIDLGQEWHERLKRTLVTTHGKIKGTELHYLYGKAFNSAYHEAVRVDNAVHDLRHLEALAEEKTEQIRVDFYRLSDETDGELRLKVYHRDTPVPLSEILPVLQNMGLKSVSETPFEVKPQGADSSFWIHDFRLECTTRGLDLDEVKENLEECFLRVWAGDAENDGLNQLVMQANLTWREVMILRTYNNYLRQAKYPHSRQYCISVLSQYPVITRYIVELFKLLHDPSLAGKSDKDAKKCVKEINDLLQAVEKLDHDRILRSFFELVEKTLRTNYFQRDENKKPYPWVAMKMDSRHLNDLPLPRPHVEIYVYSSRVEAVHLRGGRIARGGIRWSDRHDDFRTEILGLMKSQMVKNAVIVPVGAKGGFIVKNPPKEGGRDALQAEGIACYKIMVRALLSLTDNNVKGRIVRPKNVVCRDDVDPYLVVAADKGTATFSDIANGLSVGANFWLQDAFASGGSDGYDHKKMGITARGAWESVKRHFREIGKDIQTQEFTTIGVGDMGGDVFGNGMLLSKKTLLMGAFNHLHIFCDPDPDAKTSYAERLRLFKARGGWDAYDVSKLSKGGRVYERSAKSLKLTPEIKKAFGLTKDSVTPDELITALLKADTELLWFGGIGTYIKSRRESNAEADDKSNDAIRIDASEVNAQVVGEGANLGVTQLGRIEYARKGGRINTDFIDNSGGVDCSDHEVNMKILLSDVMANKNRKMTLKQRNKMLVQMTDDVAGLVLRNNYQQTQALSVALSRTQSQIGLQAEFIRELEKKGITKRSLEGLPDEETITRLQKENGGLTRPELSILLSYAKILFKNDLLQSDVLDDQGCEAWLFDYFPKDLQKYKKEISGHKLRREIIATNIASMMINRMGPVFVKSRMDKTGAKPDDVARAFMVAVEIFGVRRMWESIEALDNKVSADVQIEALHEISSLLKRTVTWILRAGIEDLGIEKEIKRFKPGIDVLTRNLNSVASTQVKEGYLRVERRLTERGVPEKLSHDIAILSVLTSAMDIVSIAHNCNGDVKSVAKTYFGLGERLQIDWLRQEVSAYTPDNSWQARVMGGLTDDFYAVQADLTEDIINRLGCPVSGRKRDLVAEWVDTCGKELGNIDGMFADLRRLPALDLTQMVLAGQRLRLLTSHRS